MDECRLTSCDRVYRQMVSGTTRWLVFRCRGFLVDPRASRTSHECPPSYSSQPGAQPELQPNTPSHHCIFIGEIVRQGDEELSSGLKVSRSWNLFRAESRKLEPRTCRLIRFAASSLI